jgi:hypothetical protein
MLQRLDLLDGALPLSYVTLPFLTAPLEEGKRRAVIEQRDSARLAELDKQRLELRSHVLTLREGELDSRLRDCDRTIEELNLRLLELTGALRKEQATRDLLSGQIADLQRVRRSYRRKPKVVAIRKPKLAKRSTSKKPKRASSRHSHTKKTDL